MNYWLVKTEPSTYAWVDLVREKQTARTGVRNFQARNNLRAAEYSRLSVQPVREQEWGACLRMGDDTL